MKQFLSVVAILFAGYFLITAPADAAGAVSGAASAVAGVFESVITFLTELFGWGDGSPAPPPDSPAPPPPTQVNGGQ